MNKMLWTLYLVGLLASCSNQQLYDAARQNYLQDCDKWEGAERERCQAQYRESYQEYERKRVDAVGDQSTD
jgi:hypothetical protein